MEDPTNERRDYSPIFARHQAILVSLGTLDKRMTGLE
jgi:hypothetical protein